LKYRSYNADTIAAILIALTAAVLAVAGVWRLVLWLF
jgi:hypothetical protein